MPTAIGLNTWHTLALSFANGFIQASLDNVVVASVYDATYPGGQAGLSVSEWINAQFDNFAVKPKGSSHPGDSDGDIAYTITNRNSGLVLEIPVASITRGGTVADQNLYTYTQISSGHLLSWEVVTIRSSIGRVVSCLRTSPELRLLVPQ